MTSSIFLDAGPSFAECRRLVELQTRFIPTLRKRSLVLEHFNFVNQSTVSVKLAEEALGSGSLSIKQIKLVVVCQTHNQKLLVAVIQTPISKISSGKIGFQLLIFIRVVLMVHFKRGLGLKVLRY